MGTEAGITVDLHAATSVFVAVWMMPLQLSRESYTGFSGSTVREVSKGQELHVRGAILVTLLEICSDVSFWQKIMPASSIVVTDSGMVREVIATL